MYSVKSYPKGNQELLLQVAGTLYKEYEYPKREFKLDEYLQLVLRATTEDIMFFCFEGDKVVGALTASPGVYDLHFNGTGRHVTNFVVNTCSNSRKAIRLLLDRFSILLIREGSKWYSTTHRRDYYTLSTKYRRVNNG